MTYEGQIKYLKESIERLEDNIRLSESSDKKWAHIMVPGEAEENAKMREAWTDLLAEQKAKLLELNNN